VAVFASQEACVCAKALCRYSAVELRCIGFPQDVGNAATGLINFLLCTIYPLRAICTTECIVAILT